MPCAEWFYVGVLLLSCAVWIGSLLFIKLCTNILLFLFDSVSCCHALRIFLQVQSMSLSDTLVDAFTLLVVQDYTMKPETAIANMAFLEQIMVVNQIPVPRMQTLVRFMVGAMSVRAALLGCSKDCFARCVCHRKLYLVASFWKNILVL